MPQNEQQKQIDAFAGRSWPQLKPLAIIRYHWLYKDSQFREMKIRKIAKLIINKNIDAFRSNKNKWNYGYGTDQKVLSQYLGVIKRKKKVLAKELYFFVCKREAPLY